MASDTRSPQTRRGALPTRTTSPKAAKRISRDFEPSSSKAEALEIGARCCVFRDELAWSISVICGRDTACRFPAVPLECTRLQPDVSHCEKPFRKFLWLLLGRSSYICGGFQDVNPYERGWIASAQGESPAGAFVRSALCKYPGTFARISLFQDTRGYAGLNILGPALPVLVGFSCWALRQARGVPAHACEKAALTVHSFSSFKLEMLLAGPTERFEPLTP